MIKISDLEKKIKSKEELKNDLDKLETRLNRNDSFIKNNCKDNSVNAIYILQSQAFDEFLDYSKSLLDMYNLSQDKLYVHELADKIINLDYERSKRRASNYIKGDNYE